MRTFKSSALLLTSLLSISVAACGSDSDKLASLEKLKDKACACTDSTCAKAAMKELKEIKGLKKDDRAKALIVELTTCVSNAMMPTP